MNQSHMNTMALSNVLKECEKHQLFKKSLNLPLDKNYEDELDTSIWMIRNWIEKNPSK